MIKCLGLFLILSVFTSCKYRESKASYSIVEVDSTRLDSSMKMVDSNPIDSLEDKYTETN